jgi:hypothetical protein
MVKDFGGTFKNVAGKTNAYRASSQPKIRAWIPMNLENALDESTR